MKILFQVEGTIDLHVLPRLVGRLIGRPIEVVEYRRKSGGCHSGLATLEAALGHGVYQGCEAAVIVIDADSTPPHDGHPGTTDEKCRHCFLSRRVEELRHRSHLRALPIAIGVPVEALESWLLQFGHVVGRAPAGRPQAMSRQEVKRRLWMNAIPTRADYEPIAQAILDRLGPDEIERLAFDQPSFRTFLDAVRTWPPACDPTPE